MAIIVFPFCKCSYCLEGGRNRVLLHQAMVNCEIFDSGVTFKGRGSRIAFEPCWAALYTRIRVRKIGIPFNPVAAHACKTHQYIIPIAFTDKLDWWVSSDDAENKKFILIRS